MLELTNETENNKKAILLIENLLGQTVTLAGVKDPKNTLKDLLDQFDFYELKLYLFNEFWLTYQSKIIELSIYGDNIIENLERSIILVNTDRIWREHLQKMTLLREAVGWRGYGQRNPLYEYKQDAFYMFEIREETLRHLVIYDLLRSSIL